MKEKLGVTGDSYSLKHLDTTEVVELLGDKEAAKMNGYIGITMARDVYDLKRKDR